MPGDPIRKGRNLASSSYFGLHLCNEHLPAMKLFAFVWKRQGRSLLLTARIPVKSNVIAFGPCYESLLDSTSPHTALGEIFTTRSRLSGKKEVLMPTDRHPVDCLGGSAVPRPPQKQVCRSD